MAELQSVTFPRLAGVFMDDSAPDLLLRVAEPSDDVQLLALVSVPMPSNGVMVGMAREPGYFEASLTQYTEPQPWVIASRAQPDQIMAMYNVGVRPCYINGRVQPLRYLGDLRVNTRIRGKGLVRLKAKHLAQVMPPEAFAQTLILADNQGARTMMHELRPDFPTPFRRDLVQTLTMTGVTGAPAAASQACAQAVQLRTATEADLSAMNAFVQQMAQHYNFMPAYDFTGMTRHDPYWRGLSPEDFTLVYRDGTLVGLFGLWNQKSFKQTRIVDYGRLMGLARPFYNVWARLAQRMPLPKRGDLVKYLMLHSPLCDPRDVTLFDVMVREAFRQTQARQESALCFTLAENDPRSAALAGYKGERIHAIHTLHSYGVDPTPQLDDQRISYFECGRV